MWDVLRRRPLLALVLLSLLIIACGEGGICESDEERSRREMNQRINQRILEDLRRSQLSPTAAVAASPTPLATAAPGSPTVSMLESILAVPVTTYRVTAADANPADTDKLKYEWSMTGEACGTPLVPWKQSGAAVRWSHSDQPPDNCVHQGTNHGVTATVVITSVNGTAIQCMLQGSDTQRLENPRSCGRAP